MSVAKGEHLPTKEGLLQPNHTYEQSQLTVLANQREVNLRYNHIPMHPSSQLVVVEL